MYVPSKTYERSLREYVNGYLDCLRSQTRYYGEQSYQYVCGLFQSERRNIEKMSEEILDSDAQGLHHFISNSPWDWDPLLDNLCWDSYQGLVSGAKEIGLILDESGWKKQGKHSVGVSRQYLGSLGKVDNGQVAVLGSLCQGDQALLVDFHLYLPKSWTEDAARCDSVGIPSDRQVMKTKPELAQDLVERMWNRGLEVAWVGADAAYGHDRVFRRWLDDQGQFYLLDVHADQQVYLEDPKPYLPEAKAGKGRSTSRLKAKSESVKAQELWKEFQEEATLYRFRKGSKGYLKRKVWTQKIYTWDGKETQARAETLIISCEANGSNLKYSLANHPVAEYPDKKLLFFQMQRFWVEQSIKEAKSELGMHQYQVRTWRAWHHHMALTCLALAFMFQTQKIYKDDVPLLSCNDIRLILCKALPKKADSEEIAWMIIKQRHIRRQADIDRYYKNQ